MGIDGAPVLGGVNSCPGDLTRIRSHCRAGGVANWRNPDRTCPGANHLGHVTRSMGIVVICAISSYILFAAMPVNYAFAVIFVTDLIVTILDLTAMT